METTKYCIVSAVHGRPEVASAWAEWLALKGPADLSVFVAGDDPFIKKELQKHLGDRLWWVPYCNSPLGAKWNRALETALTASYPTDIGATHVVILGSDDFPSRGLFAAWREWSDDAYSGPLSAGGLVVHGFRANETREFDDEAKFGSGRMFHMQGLRDLFKKRGYAWTPDISKGLDNDLLDALGFDVDDLSVLPDTALYTVKTDTQIHSYEKLTRRLSSFPILRGDRPEVREWLSWVRPKVRPADLVTIRTN